MSFYLAAILVNVSMSSSCLLKWGKTEIAKSVDHDYIWTISAIELDNKGFIQQIKHKKKHNFTSLALAYLAFWKAVLLFQYSPF